MLFFKKAKLEKQLIAEIKTIANVDEFPYQDAKIIGELLAAYNKGTAYVSLGMMIAFDTLEKYPELFAEWDQLMIKYKKLGLFPRWDVTPI